MKSAEQIAFDGVTKDLEDLAVLHPSYSRIELEESRAQILRYFDLAWAIFERLERDGNLDPPNLTKNSSSPTVKGQEHPNPPLTP